MRKTWTAYAVKNPKGQYVVNCAVNSAQRFQRIYSEWFSRLDAIQFARERGIGWTIERIGKVCK